MKRDQIIVAVIAAILLFAVLRKGVVTGDNLLFFVVLIPSIILHEVSHGAAALAFGDDTAKRAGRLTLNPISHVDPLGTIILPAILILTTGRAFGYAKPVPVNVRRLRHPRNEGLVVSLVGPFVNIVLAVAAGLALHAMAPGPRGLLVDFGIGSLAWKLLFFFGYANVILAVFNLIPIPPLDGSAVVERLLPRAWWPRYLQLRQYTFILVLLLVLVWPSALTRVFDPALRQWGRLLG